MQVNILEAKNQLSALVRIVQTGQDVVIANRGKPVALLTQAKPGSAPEAASGTAALILDWLHQHPLPPHARRTGADINAAIDAERSPWD